MCREYWANPYEGENSIREYEEAIKFCQENISRINNELPFVKDAKTIEYFNFEKNNYEKEIETYQKLIEAKTVTSKTETNKNVYNGDVFNNSGDAFGRGSKNNKTTKNTKIVLSVIVIVIISIAAVVVGQQKMDNFSITNTTETTIEPPDSKN